MVHVSELQGYLMKEKSKTGILHGLTGDINKRFFKVQKIESSGELALCYYKTSADPEVRGWIYLKDMTEIVEDQDTMIITSVARTLHLYAKTRAEHNVWVTGLAKLCPEAFIKLGRNASLLRGVDSVLTVPTFTKAKGTWPSGGESDVPALNSEASDDPADSSTLVPDQNFDDEPVPAEPQVSGSADGADSHSSDERIESGDHNRNQKRGKCNRKNNNSGSRHQTVGHTACWGTGSDANNMSGSRGGESQAGVSERRTDDRHRSFRGNVRSQSSSSVGSARSNTGQRARTSDTGGGKSRQRQWGGDESSSHPKDIDEPGSVVDNGAHPDSGRIYKGVSADHDSGDDRSITGERLELKHRPPDNLKVEPDDKVAKNIDGRHWGTPTRRRRGAREDERQISQSFRSINTTDDVEGADDEICGGKTSLEPEMAAAQKAGDCTPDHVETIDLNEMRCHTHMDSTRRVAGQGRVLDQAQEERDDSVAHTDEQTCSNQDEDRDRDQSAENDASNSPVEVISWDGPHQGMSATSRLHHHISGSEAEAMGFDDPSPAKKGTFAKGTLRSTSWFHNQEEDGGVCDGQNMVSGASKCEDVPQSSKKGRRRSAADLEWSDGGEPQDRPRRLQDKLTPSANRGPFNLGDSEDDGEGELDLEVEKQRRRANAAILALEAAAKEADEGAQADSRRGCKPGRTSEGEIVAKPHREAGTVPLPAGPPPAGATRKGRRGSGPPPSGMAPPKLAPPVRAKPSNRRTRSDESFVHDNWDD